MDNLDEKNNEIVALSSIYESSFICNKDDKDVPVGGILYIDVQLPNMFNIVFQTTIKDEEVVKNYPVSYLPPLTLHFTYCDDYPSVKAPDYSLSCDWLNEHQINKLREQLDNMWDENKGLVIMFQWAQYLKDNSLAILNVANSINIIAINSNQNNLHVTTNNIGKSSSYNNSSYSNKSSSELLCHLESRTTDKVNILKALTEYDKDKKQKLFDQKSFTCKVCFDERIGFKCIQFWPCHHVYCKECMRSYFLAQIEEGDFKLFKCPEIKCKSEVNPKQVKDLVPEDVYNKWDSLLLSSTIYSMGNVQTCPRLHCQYPATVEDNRGECPNCRYIFCISCGFGYHAPVPCRLTSDIAEQVFESYTEGDVAMQKHLEKKYGEIYIKKLVENLSSIKHIDVIARKCPNCKVDIEKNGGCSYVLCTQCNNAFIWNYN